MTGGLTYTCTEGETFDIVALNLYGDERYAHELLKANPALCRLMRFRGGEILAVPTIVIPNTDNAQENSAPVIAPWKER